MANYEGKSRSNYVHITDKEMVKNICALYNIGIWQDGENDTWGFYSENDDAGVNSWIYAASEEEEELFKAVFGRELEEEDTDNELPWFMEMLTKYIPDGEVLVWQEVGWEELRYLTGVATAMNNKGEYKQISLHNIYDLAKDLGQTITAVEY